MKRSRIRPKPLPEDERQRRAEVREQVWLRDRRCPLSGHPPAGRCFGDMTPHHLKKASQGGSYEPRNIVVLCAAMNTWVEDNPREAHELGLVVRQGETEEQAWERMQKAGLVSYGPSGRRTAPTESQT